MKILIGILVLSAALVSVSRGLYITEIPQQEITGSHILGTVEGKTYITDSISRDWASSRLFCESKEMKLATITSREQADFLKSVFDPINFNGWYWIGARMNISGEFSWVENGKEVESFKTLGTSSWSDRDKNKDCLVYSSNNHPKGYYFSRACHRNHLTLCESEHPIALSVIKTEITPKAEPELIEIGSYNGTTYFGDKVIRTWTDSFSFCKSRGLQLVTVVNGDSLQTSFLKNACHKINFDGWYWVGKIGQRGIGTSPYIATGNNGLCPYFEAHEMLYSRGPCLNRHFAICEKVEYVGLSTDVVALNMNEEKVKKNSEATMESGLDTDTVYRVFANLSAKEKKELLDNLIFMQQMDGIGKPRNSVEEPKLISIPAVSLLENAISNSNEA